MKTIAIIPTRYASTRFPGKPLAMLGEKTVIHHVYEKVASVISNLYVATDDERIKKEVESFGGACVMTSAHHNSGTDRCMEAYEKVGKNEDVLLNVQGDEPFVTAQQIETLVQCFQDERTDIATLAKPFEETATWDEVNNPNAVKVVFGTNRQALYFSRLPIPFIRGCNEQTVCPGLHHKHIGMYAYRPRVLKQIAQLPISALEQAEKLEQLRWLENGYCIKVGMTDVETIGIDTPEDLQRAQAHLFSLNQHSR